MNIQKVLKSVEIAIDEFKTAFPELIEYANIERYKSETIAAILAYEKKATIIKKDLLREELEKYFNTGKEVFDEGFHKGSNRDRADNVLIGMLEMTWIESFLNEIDKPQKVDLDAFYQKPKDMKQVFDLDNANTAYSYEPNKKLQSMVEKLNEIVILKEKLQFYNDNICSFSYSFPDGEICEYGFRRWRGCGSIVFKLVPDTEIFSLFLEIRANEISRLKELIESKEKIVDKIIVLFEDRAGNPDVENDFFKIETNQFVSFLRNGAGLHPENLITYEFNLLSEINTSEDKKDFNNYLYNFYSNIFKNPESQPLINKLENFGFNFDFAISAFRLQLQNSLDFERTLSNEIKRIEKHFPVNDFNNIIYSYYDDASSGRWKCALFNAFKNGVQYDFSIRRLEAEQVKDFLHIEQVFFYYKELLKIQKNGQNTTALSHEETTHNLEIIQNNKFLEYDTSALLEILIKKDNMLKSDYLKFIEKYNINTPEKLKAFYDDYLNFAQRKINLKILEFFKNKESQDYILNTLLKSAVEKFESNQLSTPVKTVFESLDDIFILDNENIFIRASEIFIDSVRKLANDNYIFSEWDIDKQMDFWGKFSKNHYVGWINFIEINSSISTISFLSKEITKSTKIENNLSFKSVQGGMIEDEKLTAKHYVLTFIFDCNANGESLPHGNKKLLERVGNQILGTGRGNTFYKNYNTIIRKDLNAEQTLIEEAGENWRNILLQLSKDRESLEIYLQNKQL